MSNAKVRIYDLSKELNLENKDLLEICKQLNIDHKSHSSTISEEDAERVRAIALKQHQATAKTIVPEKERPQNNRANTIAKKPQQILALHKQKRSEESENAEGPSTGGHVIQPRPPQKTQITPPKERPANIQGDEEKQTPPIKPIEVRSQPNPTVKPNLQGPRPPAVKESQGEARPPVVALRPGPKPLLEIRDHRTVDREEGGDRTRRNAPITKQERPNLTLKADVRPRGSDPEKLSEPKEREVSELKRPLRPGSAGIKIGAVGTGINREDTKTTGKNPLDSEDMDTETLIDPDGLKMKAKPKRPTVLKPGTGKKAGWEEEEEEERKAGKVAKTTGKNKRKSQVLFDDEEDLDGTLDGADSASNFSLSTARPPKPPSQAPATPAPQTVRFKRPTRNEGSSKSARVDRREPEEPQKPTSIVVEGSLTVRDLSELMKVSETDIIKTLFFKGMAVNITQTLDVDTIEMLGKEYEIRVEKAIDVPTATKSMEVLDAGDLENLQRRPPVVTIMGHVDHGKTTLLDSIRKTKVAQGEAGGITQHIGAYHVDVEHNGRPEQIVFLDTPGHEAFTAMRARGARVTDIAVLVVAADDGVQPQTREAISHARAAGVPIVVAINKVDKPDANPDRIKQELTEQGLVAEDWGGDTIMVPVSALKGQNLDSLLDYILLVSEVEELVANPDRPAKGTVIEANLDRARGPVATLLVQNGTLRVGDCIVAGPVFGKIRAMIDDRGAKVDAATPSFAVEILGLSDIPAAGDEFEVYESEKEARSIAGERAIETRNTRLQQALSSRRVSLSTLSLQAQEGQLKELNLILKADVQGSVEAILGSLQQLPQNEVQIRILFAGAGEITETDVDLAAASGAVIVGFNTTLAPNARASADREGVDIREYNIIYKLLDDIQGAMEGLLDPEEVEEPLGQAEVRAVIEVGRGSVAGCYITSGKLVRNRSLRVRRGKEIVYQGTIDSLKRFKDDVREVATGFECGVGVSKFNDWKLGDIIEAFEMTMKRRTLSN